MTTNTTSNYDAKIFDNHSNLKINSLAASGARVGFAAAICWIALGVESIVRPEQENYRDLLWMIPFTLTAVTFVFMHLVQRFQAGIIERIGFYALMVASTLVFFGNVGLLINAPALAVFSFPWGALLWMLGLVIFGIGTWTTKKIPWYVSLSIILLEPGSIVTGLALSPISPLHDRGGYSAGVEKGFVLLLCAIALRSLSKLQPK